LNNFRVPVRNELTGEVRIVEIASTYDRDAQVLALQLLFKSADWRRATAMVPELSAESK